MDLVSRQKIAYGESLLGILNRAEGGGGYFRDKNAPIKGIWIQEKKSHIVVPSGTRLDTLACEPPRILGLLHFRYKSMNFLLNFCKLYLTQNSARRQ